MARPSTGWSTSATTSTRRREEYPRWKITPLDIPVSPCPVAYSKGQSSPDRVCAASRVVRLSDICPLNWTPMDNTVANYAALKCASAG